jgi:chlorophyllide a reductase subunit Y
LGPAGAGSLAAVINAAIGSKPRFDRMTAFFDGVGKDHTAGVWHDANSLPKKPSAVARPLVEAKASVSMQDY